MYDVTTIHISLPMGTVNTQTIYGDREAVFGRSNATNALPSAMLRLSVNYHNLNIIGEVYRTVFRVI